MSARVRSTARRTTPALLPAPVPPAAKRLLMQARQTLSQAERDVEPAQRFIDSYQAALRTGAAVLTASGRSPRRRGRPTSVWVLLDSAVPELRTWTEFFAANSNMHAAAEAGITRLITPAVVEELFSQATQFLNLAHRYVYEARDTDGFDQVA